MKQGFAYITAKATNKSDGVMRKKKISFEARRGPDENC